MGNRTNDPAKHKKCVCETLMCFVCRCFTSHERATANSIYFICACTFKAASESVYSAIRILRVLRVLIIIELQ